MKTVIIHRYSSILSAYGLGMADLIEDEKVPLAAVYTEEQMSTVNEDLSKLVSSCTKRLKERGFTDETIQIKVYHILFIILLILHFYRNIYI